MLKEGKYDFYGTVRITRELEHPKLPRGANTNGGTLPQERMIEKGALFGANSGAKESSPRVR